MRPSIALQRNIDAIKQIAQRHRARNVRVFGSVLHGTDRDDSDLDLLIEPLSDMTLMDVAALQVALEALLCVAVDVVTPGSLPSTFRARVLAEAAAL